MNNVNLIGRLTRDPEIRWAQDGKAIANYTIAVNRFGEGADFIPCVTFGKGAEFAEKWLHKGMKIAVTGRIQTGSYEKDGRKVNTWEINVRDQEFCEKKRAETPEDFIDAFVEVPEGEVPFA